LVTSLYVARPRDDALGGRLRDVAVEDHQALGDAAADRGLAQPRQRVPAPARFDASMILECHQPIGRYMPGPRPRRCLRPARTGGPSVSLPVLTCSRTLSAGEDRSARASPPGTPRRVAGEMCTSGRRRSPTRSPQSAETSAQHWKRGIVARSVERMRAGIQIAKPKAVLMIRNHTPRCPPCAQRLTHRDCFFV
jgi:hypothetical protein